MRNFIIERNGKLSSVHAAYDLNDISSDQSVLDAYYDIYDEEWKDAASIVMEVTTESVINLLNRLEKAEKKIVSLKRSR